MQAQWERASGGAGERSAGKPTRLEVLREKFGAPEGRPNPSYGQARYRAASWSRERRVIFKSERTECEGRAPQVGSRFVVTNIGGSPERIYRRIYCQRGDIENRI